MSEETIRCYLDTAVLLNHIEGITRLLRKEFEKVNGTSCLNAAVENKNVEIIELLLTDPRIIVDNGGSKALYTADIIGSIPVMRALISEYPVPKIGLKYMYGDERFVMHEVIERIKIRVAKHDYTCPDEDTPVTKERPHPIGVPHDTDSEDMCAICIETREDHGLIRLSCGHLFHGTCIDTWACKTNTCPICRQALR